MYAFKYLFYFQNITILDTNNIYINTYKVFEYEMNILDCLIESFDTKPVPFKVTRTNEYGADYKFSIDNMIYTVDFSVKNNGADVMFMAQTNDPTSTSTLNLTGTGNQYKVLITVIEIIKEFILERDLSVLTFSASKNELVGDARPNVYRRLIKREITNLPGQWVYREKDIGNKVKFALLDEKKINAGR